MPGIPPCGSSSSSGGQLVHGNSQVPQLLVLGIVGYLTSGESYCSVSVQVFGIWSRNEKLGFPQRLDRLILL